MKVVKEIRYRFGATHGTFVQDRNPDLVDSGTATVSTQRAVFAGATSTREWLYSKVIDVEASTDQKVIMVHVSNRQKASGLAGGPALTEVQVVELALCDRTV